MTNDDFIFSPIDNEDWAAYRYAELMNQGELATISYCVLPGGKRMECIIKRANGTIERQNGTTTFTSKNGMK